LNASGTWAKRVESANTVAQQVKKSFFIVNSLRQGSRKDPWWIAADLLRLDRAIYERSVEIAIGSADEKASTF